MEKKVYVVEALLDNCSSIIGIVDIPVSPATIKLMSSKIDVHIRASREVGVSETIYDKCRELFESMSATEDDMGYNEYARLTQTIYIIPDKTDDNGIDKNDILLFSGDYKHQRYKEEVINNPFVCSSVNLKCREAVLLCEKCRQNFLNDLKNYYSDGFVIVNEKNCGMNLYEYINFLMMTDPMMSFYVNPDGKIKTTSGLIIEYVNSEGNIIKFPTDFKKLKKEFPSSE